MHLLRATPIIAALALTSCAHVQSLEAPLTPSELNAQSEYYDGRIVSVKGFLNIVPGGHIIYESKEHFEAFSRREPLGRKEFNPRDYIKFCLTIENWGQYEHLSGRTLVFKGTFHAHYRDGVADLGACPLDTGIAVKSVRPVL